MMNLEYLHAELSIIAFTTRNSPHLLYIDCKLTVTFVVEFLVS